MIDENYWNESESQIIDEHIQYHEDMVNYLKELKKDGPTNHVWMFGRVAQLWSFRRIVGDDDGS